MNKFECSPDTPWGIHQSLQAYECPRCGWAADCGPVLSENSGAADQLGWTVVAGGLSEAA